MIIDERLVIGRDADGGLDKIGQLESARMANQIQQLETLGILQPAGKLTADAVMTSTFLSP